MFELVPGTVIVPPGGTLWICGKWPSSDGDVLEFQGVFSTEEAAVGACKTEKYFVAPAKLNEECPDAPTPWPGFYYPSEREKQA